MLTSKVLSQIAFENVFSFPGGVSYLSQLDVALCSESFICSFVSSVSVDFEAWQEFNIK